ncbi:hypothetical protein GCM10010255_40870 [Streptomyces coeruleofuscus]|uniref:Deaminase n=1 Tax=Streptomyces coeruleofuscus TaxID=66879 RepID=A0ABN3IGW1_9ACTN
MSELLVDFITSLDGHASGEGWPGFWGLEGGAYADDVAILAARQRDGGE